MVCIWGEIGAKLTRKIPQRFGAGLGVERASSFGCGEDVIFSPNVRAVSMRGQSRSWRKKENRETRQILFAGNVEEEVDDSQKGSLDRSVPVTGCLSNTFPGLTRHSPIVKEF